MHLNRIEIMIIKKKYLDTVKHKNLMLGLISVSIFVALAR